MVCLVKELKRQKADVRGLRIPRQLGRKNLMSLYSMFGSEWNFQIPQYFKEISQTIIFFLIFACNWKLEIKLMYLLFHKFSHLVSAFYIPCLLHHQSDGSLRFDGILNHRVNMSNHHYHRLGGP